MKVLASARITNNDSTHPQTDWDGQSQSSLAAHYMITFLFGGNPAGLLGTQRDKPRSQQLALRESMSPHLIVLA